MSWSLIHFTEVTGAILDPGGAGMNKTVSCGNLESDVRDRY